MNPETEIEKYIFHVMEIVYKGRLLLKEANTTVEDVMNYINSIEKNVT